MKKTLKFVIFIAFLSVFSVTKATDLRGKIQNYNPYSNLYYPVPGLRVEFWYFNSYTNNWVCGAYTSTDSNGMYYFTRVNPNFNYYIKVVNKFYPLYVYNLPLQDIPIITI